MRLGLRSLAPSRPCRQGAGQKTPEGHSGQPLPWPGRRRDSKEPESSRFHQLGVLPCLCPGAGRGAPGYRVAHGGCHPPPRLSQGTVGAWGPGSQHPRSSPPLRTGPLRLPGPHGPSPTTLFPAHPAPSDASHVTADNLDLNQEITPPLPAPLMGSARRTPRPEPRGSAGGRAASRPAVPPVSQLAATTLSTANTPRGSGGRGAQARRPC